MSHVRHTSVEEVFFEVDAFSMKTDPAPDMLRKLVTFDFILYPGYP
jgi:hypothetical protein